MKIKKILHVVSLALPTLATIPAGAWNHQEPTSKGTGYSATANGSTSATVATFDRGGVTTESITYYNWGITRGACTSTTVSSGSALVSYWQESDTWDEGCFSEVHSVIQEISDPLNNFADGSLRDDFC